MICLCLASASLKVNSQSLALYRKHIDLLEYRFDRLAASEREGFGPWLAAEFARHGLGGILTLRLPADGGAWEDGEDLRRSWMRRILQEAPHGALAWVDLEAGLDWPDIVALARERSVGIIRSAHDFGGPGELESLDARLQAMAADGALPKYAAMVRGSADLLTLLQVARRWREAGRQFILAGMGAAGVCVRILAPVLGSTLSYTSPAPADFPDLDPASLGAAAAPGQLDPRTLDERFAYHRQNKGTAIFGIIGKPVLHSRSPEYHNQRFGEGRMNAVYVPFEVDDMVLFRQCAAELAGQGFSVTVPHKEAALGWGAEQSDAARMVGAANTLVQTPRGYRAENTDVQGFMAPLLQAWQALRGNNADLAGLRVLLAGAGGAGRAALFGLLGKGAQVVLANRTVERAASLARDFAGHGTVHPCSLDAAGIARALAELNQQAGRATDTPFDLVVNTTTTGMAHTDSEGVDPLWFWSLRSVALVYDIIYTPERTALLERAIQDGCPVLNGKAMFEAQAAAQAVLFRSIVSPGGA